MADTGSHRRPAVMGCVLLVAVTTLYCQMPATDGLLLWLKSDEGVTVNAEGEVTRWEDQSGNGAHATVGYLPSSPALGGPSMMHGGPTAMPLVEFVGPDQEALEGKFPAARDHMTLFIAGGWRPGTTFGHAQYMFSAGPQSGGGWGHGNHVSVSKEGGYYCMWGYPSGEPGHIRGGTYPGGLFITAVRYRPKSQTPNHTVYLNGIEVNRKNYQLADGDDFLNQGYYSLGRWSYASYPWFGNVAIGELLVYNREFSDSERRQVEDYLGCRYLDTQCQVPVVRERLSASRAAGPVAAHMFDLRGRLARRSAHVNGVLLGLPAMPGACTADAVLHVR